MARMSARTTTQRLFSGLSAPSGDRSPVLDEASVFHFPGGTGLAGAYQGWAAILGLLERLMDLTDGTLEFVPGRSLGRGGDTSAFVTTARGARRGKRLETTAVHVLTRRGNCVRELWLLHPDQQRVDEFWID